VDVAAQCGVFFHRHDIVRPAAQRFEGDGPTARADIKKPPAIQPLAQNVEQRLPDTISRGAR
jgi:hypothetical protein